MADIKEETEIIKKDLVELIIKHLRENKLTPEKAKQLATDFYKDFHFRIRKIYL